MDWLGELGYPRVLRSHQSTGLKQGCDPQPFQERRPVPLMAGGRFLRPDALRRLTFGHQLVTASAVAVRLVVTKTSGGVRPATPS